MPIIFKNIRRKLAAENRTMAYLRYAVGEIFLVVIGILIALQVNNWNQRQKARASEQVVLKALLKEFRHNGELLDRAIQLNDSNIASARQLGEYTGPKLKHVDSRKVPLLMTGVLKDAPHYLPSLGTLLDVINSGKLSLLTNQKLRADLAAFQSELDNVHTQEGYVVKYQNKLFNFFLKEGNFRQLIHVTNDSVHATPGRFPPNDFKFLENPEFENYLYLFIASDFYLNKHYYEPQKARQDTIISLIQSELK